MATSDGITIRLMIHIMCKPCEIVPKCSLSMETWRTFFMMWGRNGCRMWIIFSASHYIVYLIAPKITYLCLIRHNRLFSFGLSHFIFSYVTFVSVLPKLLKMLIAGSSLASSPWFALTAAWFQIRRNSAPSYPVSPNPHLPLLQPLHYRSNDICLLYSHKLWCVLRWTQHKIWNSCSVHLDFMLIPCWEWFRWYWHDMAISVALV